MLGSTFIPCKLYLIFFLWLNVMNIMNGFAKGSWKLHLCPIFSLFIVHFLKPGLARQ